MATLADLEIGIGANTSGLRQDFDKVPQMADDAVDETENIFEGMGGKISAAAKVAGAAAGAALVSGVVGAMNMEGATDKLSAQLDLTADESEQAGEIAGGLYADAYGDSFGHVNEAVGAVVSTLNDDLSDTSSIESLTTKALDLAGTFDTDVNESVATAGVLMKTGLAADANEAFDLITAGMQEMPAALRDELGEATTEYSRFFADLGFTGEETFALFAQADDQFALDKTGDALKELSIRATDMSTASVEAYEAAGLDAEVMADKILAGGDTAREGFDEIVGGLLDIEDPTERANAAIGLFGTPLEDLGTAQIPDFLRSLQGMGDGLGEVEGRADEMGQKLNRGTGVALETLKRSFFTVATDVGSIFLPAMADGAAALTEKVGPAVETATAFINDSLIPGIESVAGWMERWRTPITVVAGMLLASYVPAIVRSGVASTVSAAKQVAAWTVTRAAAIKTVALAPVHAARTVASWVAMSAAATWNAAKMAASWVVSHVTGAATALASLAAAVAATVAGWVTMAAQSLAQAARMAAAWVIALGPVGWAIAAVVALVAVVIANWDTVVKWTRKAWTWVSEKVTEAWEWIKGATSTAVNAVIGFFDGLRKGTTKLVRETVKAHVDFWSGLVGKVVGFVSGLVRSVVGFFNGIRTRTTQIVRTLVANNIAFWSGLVRRVIGFVSNLKNRVLGFFGGLRDGAVDRITSLVDRVMAIKDRVLGFFSGAHRWLLNAGRNIISGLIDGIRQKIGGIASIVSNAAQTVRDFWPFSPAKRGPLSGSGSPDKAGANLIGMIASGMGGEVGRLSSMADRAALAAMPQLGGPNVRGVVSPSAVRSGAGSRQVVINLPNYLGDKREVAQMIRDEFAKGSRRGDTVVASVARQ